MVGGRSVRVPCPGRGRPGVFRVPFVSLSHPSIIDVLVVDDDPLVRAWLRAALRKSELRLAGEAGSGTEALALLERRHVDVLIIDFRLAEGLGTDVVLALRRRGDLTPAILITAVSERGLNERAREAGAQGTLVKTTEGDDLLVAVRRVAAGGEWFDSEHPRRPSQQEPLTGREREVLGLIARGRTNREIGAELGIGDESVKTYIERLYTKLGVRRRSEAVDAGHRLGLLSR